jgi:16S rRNA processing protein RimM
VRVYEELVAIGRLLKPRGLKGELLIVPFSDRPNRFPSLRRAFLPGEGGSAREVAITSCWPHKGRFVVKLAGIDSIEAAERLRGLELRIGEEDLEALPAGAYYHYQLKGLCVEDEFGSSLGRVDDILATGGGADVLVVRGPQGESLIPLAADFVEHVDLAAGRIRVRPPEFLNARA